MTFIYSIQQQNLMEKKVGIIGAGPAGLATAIALRKQGINVYVYEKAKAFRPIGAGLNLSPNGLKSLKAIDPDIFEQLQTQASQIKKFKLRTSKIGFPLITQNITGNDYDCPFMAVRWFKLQEILRSKLPEDCLHLNHHLTDFTQDSNGVQLFFANGKTETVDLLIGADGVRSAVRQKLFGIASPSYGGWMTWRGILKYQHRLLPPHQATVFGTKGKIILLLDNGNGYLSWSLEMRSETCDRSKNSQETKARVIQELAKWHPVVREIIDHTDTDLIVERPIGLPLVLPHWTNNRVTLVGAAAHYMGPALGQGTNSSFEDVWVLSNCLSQCNDPIKALDNYEKIRIERATVIQYRTIFSAAQMLNPFLQAKKFKPSLGEMPELAKLGMKEFSHWLYSYPQKNEPCPSIDTLIY